MEKMIIEQEDLENYDGLIGDGTGHFDTESENAKISMERLKEFASIEQPNREARRKLLQIKWRMEDYLRDEFYPGQNDIPSILCECVEAVAAKHKDFAAYTGIMPSNFSAMLKGRRSIGPSFALKLEQFFSIPATLWLGVQDKNELEILRKNRFDFTPPLSLTEFKAKVGEAKQLPALKAIKYEPTRKTAGK